MCFRRQYELKLVMDTDGVLSQKIKYFCENIYFFKRAFRLGKFVRQYQLQSNKDASI